MKKAKMIVSVLLVFALLLSFSGMVFAVKPETPETEIDSINYTNIRSCDCSLSISGLTATAKANLKAQSSMSLSITMELQKLKSGSYETIKTWSASKTGTSLYMEESRLINALATYRLKVTFNAGGETAIRYAYA